MRGVGLGRAQNYGDNFNEYLNWQKNNIIIILQIEHHEAIKNLESLLDFSEVDGVMIGPYDLSASLGIPGKFTHEKYQSAYKKIIKSTLKFKKI